MYLPAFQKWSGWRELHSRPPPSEGGRLLLTLHPEIGCQTWTRTKTSGLTGRRATLTPPGNGAAGRSSTCIVPLGRRVPHVFGHSSNLKLVSAAGFAPAVTRSQGACARPQDCSVDPGKLVSAGRIALPSSSFRGRPSAADITP